MKQLARTVELDPLDPATQQPEGECHPQTGNAARAVASLYRAVETRTGIRR